MKKWNKLFYIFFSAVTWIYMGLIMYFSVQLHENKKKLELVVCLGFFLYSNMKKMN